MSFGTFGASPSVRVVVRSALAVALLATTWNPCHAQLTVTPQTNLVQLAESITGPGVVISNPVITCHAQGFGEFTYSGTAMDVDQGVILTTGRMTDAVGPNNNGGSNWYAQGGQGSALLDAVTGRSTKDVCKFEFDIIPSGDSLKFDFVFASEEYNEWVGSQFNDVFGFFISGPGITGDPGAGSDHNIALIPGTSTPVTINNVNNGSNNNYYHDNAGGAHIQYDGFTVGLSASSSVTPCSTYHLKLIVADASDRKYDSGVFIDQVESNTITMSSYTANGSPDMVEGCNPGWVRFDRGLPRPTPLTVPYFIQGTATNGTDYSAIAPLNPNLAKSIVIPANQSYVDRPVNPLADAVNETTETLKFILGNPNCPGQRLDSLIFNIVDTLIATVQPVAPVICAGGSVQFQVTGGASYAWTPSTGLSCTNCANPIASPATTTTYTVTITDGTCSRTVNRQVRVSNLTLSGTRTHPLCAGNSNGAIDLSLSGGVAPYTYSWVGPNGFTSSNQDVSGVQAGTYTVTVTDAACTATHSFNLIAPGALSVSLAAAILPFGQNISCFGGHDGSIDATVLGGTGPYVISWTGPGGFTSNSVDLINLGAGIYTLTVTDAHGCSASANTTLIQTTEVVASIATATGVVCFGDGTGSATAATTGGVPPYAYVWSSAPVQTTATASALPAGTYSVTATDGYGCTDVITATISGPTQALVGSISAQTNVHCFGNSTGSATISASGGTAPYNYAWNTTPAQSNSTAVNLPAGTWTCTITDAHGCSTSQGVTITQPASSLITSLFAQTNVVCFGNNSGSATVSASGGVGPYSYAWNTTPVQNSATAINLTAGTYTCTITDVNGCSSTRTATITQPATGLSSNISASTNVLCFGSTTGGATVAASGGTAPYTYYWNSAPAQTTASMSNVGAGTYTCTITDATGCSTTRNVTITQPASALSASITAQTNVLCFGNNTGSATVTPSGGTGAYTYSWNTTPVQTSATAINLAAGTYTCTITDANTCSIVRSVTITQPAAALATSISSQTNVSCFGNSNGAATVSAVGGTGPYSYSWNTTPAQTTASATNMTDGTWTCTVTDANGCTSSANAIISQPASVLSASITAQTNVLCFGNNTGNATVSAIGGTTPYAYNWNSLPQQSAATANNLSAGTYTCTITDVNGCSTTVTATVSQPAAGISTSSAIIPALCQGANDGSVDLTINGGTGPFNTTWSGPNGYTASTVDISLLPAGVYTLLITDGNGCTHNSAYMVTEPGLFQTSATPSLFTGGYNVSCAGNNDGSIDATVTGATPPYTYSWTGPNGFTASTEDISGLQTGTYIFIVTDVNGCQATETVVMTASAAVASALSSPDLGNGFNISCNGGNNASINASTAGGMAPLTYAWTGPGGYTATTEDITNLIAGTYSFTATDANGCSTNAALLLDQPTALAVNTVSSVQVGCYGGSNGSAIVSATGGVAPYQYNWNTTPPQTGPSAAGLPAGTWTVTVTDGNGCSATQSVTIAQPALALSASASSTTNALCFGNATGAAIALATGGTAPFGYSWNTTPQQNSANATGLTAGTYTCSITDANGCSTSTSATIAQPAAILSVSIGTVHTVSCNGGVDGSATAVATGGTAPYGFSWNTVPIQNTANLIGVSAGTYTVTTTDAHGCTTNAQVTITAPSAALSVALASSTPLSCFGSNNGQATVAVAGGTAPYTYSWNTTPTQTGATANGLANGTWTATVTDAKGCTASLGVAIGGPSAALSLAASSINDVLCHGASTGDATVTALGGTAPYTYSWLTLPVVNGTTLTNVAAGTYTAVVTDANGCTAATNVSIGEPATGISSFVEDYQNVSCFGGSDGFATIEASGGSGSYTIEWSTVPVQMGNTASGLSAGVYTVMITDNNGCDTPKDHLVFITQPVAPLVISATVGTYGSFNVACNGGDNGWIDASVTGGTAPYNYTWTDDFGGITGIEDLTTLTAGNYYLAVVDANGCTTNATFTLTEPAALAATANTTTAACQGGSDGAIDLSVSGGSSPYGYIWMGPNGYTANTQDISNLPAGVYTVDISDANGCTLSETYDVNQPGIFTITASLSTINGNNVACSNSTDGSIDATITGGTLPYNYAWTGPNGFIASTQDISGLAAGTYQLTIVDGNGCGTFANYTLVAPNPLAVNLGSSHFGAAQISCNGGTNGTINASVIGGTVPYTYDWTGPNGFNASTQDLSGLSAGTYTITVYDLNGCSATNSITLVAPALLTSSVVISQFNSGSAIACNGGSTGLIDLSLLGGQAPYSVVWSGPNGYTANTPDIGGLAAGTYNAVITDANGCVTSIGTTLTQPTAMSLGSVVSSYVGGTAISCNGASNGSINITISGGAGNNTFQWTGTNAFTSTSEDLSGLAPGTYTVIATDQNGCSSSASFTLTAPTPVTSTATVITAECQGTNDGAVDLLAAGGTAPYTYFWSGPGAFSSNNEDLANLFAGVYTVTITDANGCTGTSSYSVNQPGLFTINANLSGYPGGFNTSCAGNSDGSIDANISGGTSPYYYFWSGPNGYTAITQDITGLAAGSYQLTLTDQNGCSTLAQYTITGASPLQIGLQATTYSGGVNTTCNGVSDGGINATISGGLTPYTIAWNGPSGFSAITEDITSLLPGSYTITVTDVVGCSASANINLSGPAPMNAAISTSIYGGGNGVSCDGANDGSIDLTASGGTLPYVIQWAGPNGFASNNADISGLAGGTYTLAITDANGCTAAQTVALVSPAPIALTLDPSLFSGGVNIPCSGDDSGTINTVVTGGNGTYTYQWAGPNAFSSTDANLTDLSAGTYTLTVTDNIGCTATSNITLDDPQPLNAAQSISDVGNGFQVSCSGNDGSINLTVSGGTAPYQFDWTGPNGFAALTEDLNGIGAGVYTVDVQDANGCSYTNLITLTAPGTLQATLAVSGNVCDGTDDGAIDLTLTGGTGPYTTTWTGPGGFSSSTEDISALAGGVYTVNVTDAGTCFGSWSATIAASQPYVFSLYVSDYGNVNIPCAGDSTGVIEVQLSGGAGAVNIAWTGPNGFTANNITAFSGLVAGDYTVNITDVNGCALDSTITLTQPSLPMLPSLSAYLYPGGTNIGCNGSSDGSIDLTVIGGTAPYLFDWRGPDTTSYSTEDISGLLAGTYELVITDSNQCSYSTSILLTQPDSALTSTITMGTYSGGFNTSCNGNSDGTIHVIVLGGSGGDSLLWTGPNGFTSAADSLSGLSAGTYVLSASDINGCSITDSVTIVAPQPLDLTLDAFIFPSGSNTSCAGNNDGSIDASVFGGVPAYLLSWSGPNGFTGASAVINGLEPGTYCLTVVDTNNCSVQECVTLIANAMLSSSTSSTSASCGATNGSVDLTVSGGGAPFTFVWENGAQTEDLTGVIADTYTVSITDANGCTLTDSALVDGSVAVNATAIATNVLCHGGNDGAIDLTVLAGTGPFSFNWSNGANAEDLSGLIADDYTITITDSLGCTWSEIITVDQNDALTADTLVSTYTNGYNVSGYNATDGSIELDVSGGTAPYTYDWSNGTSGSTANGLAAGTYNVIITDVNGCSLTLEFTLTQPTDLVMPTGFSPNGDGSNDTYVVHGLDGFDRNKIIVFNRWGNVVFEQINYRNDWSGQNLQNEPLPNGTYFVIVEIADAGINMQNYVDLRR